MRIAIPALVLLTAVPALADKVAVKAPLSQPAISAAAAAKIPDAGWLVAYESDDDHLVITRLTKTGPKELVRLPHDSSHYTTWIDAKTLVDVNVDYDKNIEVKWIVDGVIDAKRTVKHKATVWALKTAEEDLRLIGAHVGADGSLWLERCVKVREPDCKKSGWLRVDTATPKPATSKPAKLTYFGKTPTAPTIKPPAGYGGKIVKVKSTVDPKRKVTAIECTGPKGKTVWSQESPPIDPAEQFTPKKVRWISATPPLFEVEGLFINPVDQRSTVQYVFRDCAAPPLGSVDWIGDSAWSYTNHDDYGKLNVLVDDMPIAVLAGHWVHAAPK